MDIQRAWVFRGCHVFDTHEAIFYLNEEGSIVWLQSKEIKESVLWVLTWKRVEWHIWNPVVYAIDTMSVTKDSTETILWELNITYTQRIARTLENIQISSCAA
jgi:hypothetical protein